MTNLASINDSDIAVIGISCRFPGAQTAEEFWENLRDGVESITTFSDQELLAEGISPSILKRPDYVKAGSVISDFDQFDAGFFDFSPKEAQFTDPQQRIFLECAWQALEDAGHTVDRGKKSIGVYAGAGMTSYFFPRVSDEMPFLEAEAFSTLLGNDKDYLATHASYKLDLKGPGVSIQTACSSSLVATHMACQSLISGECDIALAGGISVRTPHKSGYFYHEAMMLSPDGHCRSFDKDSQGTVAGNGAGVVALKRLVDAIDDGDTIYAVIKGSAINNDGAGKIGFTAPSVEGQAAVISEAQAVADVDPDTISYVEAHGTATKLGDPIEIAALTRAFRQGTDKKGYCPIGSVKSNFGHLDAAAGIAGLIKTVLSLKNRKIPPSLNFKDPNPNIDFTNSPFYVNTELVDWNSDNCPRRAGVSSFGMGGTNAHVVLEEAPIITPYSVEAANERPQHVLTLSAKTAPALNEQIENYETYLKKYPNVSFADVCYTAAASRSHFDYRMSLVANSVEHAQAQLQSKNYLTSKACVKTPKIAFLFTGQGAQYANMGRQLFESQPLFRETLSHCDAILRDLNVPLLEILYDDKSNAASLNQTIYTQPALFSLEYALAQVWLSWGVKPDAVMGHSVGEYVAACIAGVFSLEDGLKLIAARGRLMQNLCDTGDMLALPVSESKALDLIAPFAEKLSLAAINSPENVVVSGDSQSIDRLSANLAQQGIKAKQLSVSHAFHSIMMEPMLTEFQKVANSVSYSLPTIPFCSNVTGTVESDEVIDPAYWVRQVRQPVRFAAGVNALEGLSINAFLEVGPKPVLLGMASQCLPQESDLFQLPSLREGEQDWRQLLDSLGQWHCCGGNVDWHSFDEGYGRRKIQLPTYPFQRQRYWLDATSSHKWNSQDSTGHPLLNRQFQMAGKSEIGFQSEINASSTPWLISHRVYDSAVFPATAYLEMAFAAGEQFVSDQLSELAVVQLQDVVFEQACILPENEKTAIQLVLSPESKDITVTGKSLQALNGQDCSFQVFSQDNDSQWISHLSGSLSIGSTDEARDAIDLNELLSQCPTSISASEQYQNWRSRGINYGAEFQVIQQLFLGDGIAMGKIDLSGSLLSDIATDGESRLHPALFDACLQLMLVVMMNPSDKSDGNWLPTGMKKVQVYGAAKSPLWSIAKVIDSTGTDANEESLLLNVSIFDESGIPVASIEGLTAMRMDGETLRRHFKKQDDCFYEIDWVPSPIDSHSDKKSDKKVDNKETKGRWLVFADTTGVGRELANKLEDQGDSCTLVYSSISPVDDKNTSSYYLNPTDPDEFTCFFKEFFEKDDVKLKGIFHLWSLDTADTDELTAVTLKQSQALTCGSALLLLQSMIGLEKKAKTWFVTRQSVTGVMKDESDLLAIAQAPLWGMGKVIAQEHPELWGGMIDNPTAIDLLAEVNVAINNDHKEDQIAYWNGQRYVARLIKSLSPPTESHVSLDTEKSYLITGGLGKLGLKLAQWMVDKGARYLVLTGRSHPNEEALTVIKGLENVGAKVYVINTDIAIESQAADLFKQIDANMPSLKGIVHAAGIVDREALSQQNWNQFNQGAEAKVEGSWNLHLHSQPSELDFFVFFSSSASILGGINMGSYAAANSFMDALASFRAQQGLPSLSINWNSWADGGMSGKNDASDGLDSFQEFMLSTEKGMEIFDALTAEPELVQTFVFPGSIPKYLQEFYPGHIPPFLSDLSQDPLLSSGTHSIKGLLEKVSKDEFDTILADFIREKLAAVLRTNVSQIDVHESMNSMGLDSLMAVGLRNHIRSELGSDISMAKIMGDGTTVLDLVAELNPRPVVNVKPKEALQEGEEEFKV